jgi:hypothetical protein
MTTEEKGPMARTGIPLFRRRALLATVGMFVVSGCSYEHQIGEDSWKIRRDGGDVFVWAGGDSTGPGAEWYDFTGAPFDPEDLQYGIGRDVIRAIDDPVFVSSDDERLLTIPPSPYRDEPVETTGDIMVVGYMMEGQPRAYPTALLDQHELVNDEFLGKPVSVGW